MGKARDVFKKIGDIKGTFQEKIKTRTIKDKNSKDLTGAEVIKKRLQEYTEELYYKLLKTWIIIMVWFLTYSQTSWSVKSSGP